MVLLYMYATNVYLENTLTQTASSWNLYSNDKIPKDNTKN